jgi:PAS domain S-box-containing protein
MSPAYYQLLFDQSPVSIWVEDFSKIVDYVSRLKAEKITDIRAYFMTYPDKFVECISLLRVVDVNQATLNMYKAKSTAELLENIERVFTKDSAACLLESVVALSDGKQHFAGNGVNYDLDGNKLTIRISWNIPGDGEVDYRNIIVAIQDITEMVNIRNESEGREALFRCIFEQSSEGMMLVSKTGKVFLVNEAFSGLTGLNVSQIVDREVWEIFSDFSKLITLETPAKLTKEYFLNIFARPEGGDSTYEYSYLDSKHKLHAHKMNVVRIKTTQDDLFALITTDMTAVYRSEAITHILHRISHQVNVESSLDELFRTIHEALGRLIDVKNFYIALYDSKSNLITFPYLVDEMNEDGSPVEADHEISLTAQIISEARPLLLDEETIKSRVELKQVLWCCLQELPGSASDPFQAGYRCLVVQS